MTRYGSGHHFVIGVSYLPVVKPQLDIFAVFVAAIPSFRWVVGLPDQRAPTVKYLYAIVADDIHIGEHR